MVMNEQEVRDLISAPTESLAVEMKAWIDPSTAAGQEKLLKGDLAKNSGFCRTLGDSRKPVPEFAAAAHMRSHQAVSIRCYCASISPSSGRFCSFRTSFTKNATEPNSATYKQSEGWQNAFANRKARNHRIGCKP